jgi:hypothetical protein
MDAAVHRACDRGQAAGVSEGLEISAGGIALVGGEDAREGLAAADPMVSQPNQYTVITERRQNLLPVNPH